MVILAQFLFPDSKEKEEYSHFGSRFFGRRVLTWRRLLHGKDCSKQIFDNFGRIAVVSKSRSFAEKASIEKDRTGITRKN